jgi:hypothetical protein
LLQQDYWQEFAVVVVAAAAETLLSIRAHRYYYLGYIYSANAGNS